MKMSQMFKTTLAAAMIMALAVNGRLAVGAEIKKSAGAKRCFETGSQFANGNIRWPREWRLLIKSLLKNPTALLH